MQFVYVGTVSDNEPYGKTVKIFIETNANNVQDHYMLHMKEYGFGPIYDHISGTIAQAMELANQFVTRSGKYSGVNNSI